MDTFIYPFTHCVFLLAMATPVRKIFTTNVGQMQRRRHHMAASSLHSLFRLVLARTADNAGYTRRSVFQSTKKSCYHRSYRANLRNTPVSAAHRRAAVSVNNV